MPDHYNATHKVAKLHVDSEGVHIEHETLDTLKFLKKGHPNYQALYSLAYVAASNGLPLRI